MEMKYIAIAGIVAVALLVCGCAGAVIVVPALNNELPAAPGTTTIADPAMASDPVVGKWKMADPVIKNGDRTIDETDARWTFGADGSYQYHPLLIDLFKTTGTWAKVGTDRYEIVCGKDSQVKHFNLVDGQLCSEEDPRYVLVKIA